MRARRGPIAQKENINYKRKGFHQITQDIELGHVKRLIIGSEDRFVRFGYDWFEAFCERHGTALTVMNGESFSPRKNWSGI